MTAHDYCVLDLETTGLDPRADQIIEIGVHLSGALEAESILVRVDAVPEHITGITGITQKDVDGGVSLAEALGWLIDRVGDAPLIVGHNFRWFDWDFLMHAEAEAHIDLPWNIGQVRDTAALFLAHRHKWAQLDGEHPSDYQERVMRSRPRFGKYNLVHACLEMGVPTDDIQAHRAAGDVTMTNRLYLALLANPVVRPVAAAVRL